MKVLMVLTSHEELGSTGKKTGFWLEEFAAPYYVFKDSGAETTLASPKGGILRNPTRGTRRKTEIMKKLFFPDNPLPEAF